MTEPLLVAEALCKTYAPRGGFLRKATAAPPALADASLSLGKGEILGIVGESGSGKTTLARCVALLERPDSGRVLFHGEDLTALPPAALRQKRRLIQTIFQDPYASLNPRLTVGGAIGEVIAVHRLAPPARIRSRVLDLLARVGLPASAADAYPKVFSGGQRQRICIARALAAEPEILIADEPVSSLDVSIRAQIVNLLLDLSESSGLAILFIGHDLPLIDFIAPRKVVMLAGRIVETLEAGVAMESARHDYTRQLLAAVPSLDGPSRPAPGSDRNTPDNEEMP
jgi:ABC-type glutathione transport system ATPase component